MINGEQLQAWLLFNWQLVLAAFLVVFIYTLLVWGVSALRYRSKLTAQELLFQQHQTSIQSELVALDSEKHHLEDLLQQQQKQLNDEGLQSQQQLSEIGQLNTQLTAMQVEMEQQQLANQRELNTLLNAKEQLTQEFQNLANRIFEEKADRFNKHSRQTMELTLNPFREQIQQFKKQVETVYDKETRDRMSLGVELQQLKELNRQMSDEAINLTRALKGENKTQGNWGEMVLGRVLEQAGLRSGHEYSTQVSLNSADGKRRSPDVIVHLPEQKDIIIDAKVSLNAYEAYYRAENDTERELALKEHLASLKTHIDSLSMKNYEGLDGIRTLDFIFMFVPIEAAFVTALDADQSLFRRAYEKNIVVVSPTTLQASLRTVASIWRYQRQNKNAEEIARQAGAMHDKFVAFIGDIDNIGLHLTRANESKEAALNKLSTGRGNLITTTMKLEKLGAKVKKQLREEQIPEDMDLLQEDESINVTESVTDDVKSSAKESLLE